MDADAYAQQGVALANAPMSSVDDLRTLLADRPWWHDKLRRQDVSELSAVKSGLREVFEIAAGNDEVGAVDALNALLEAHPMRPRISGHDSRRWHLHVTGHGAGIGAEYGAGAVWGLAVAFTKWGASRFGLCSGKGCDNVYLDTSTNASRRFCSDRCATRAHVAAHRARKRAQAT
ncbi:CGNR zinc finger domain-containing protein [Fodinicola acaciae]|uniref:CGNR zinc finger domain-containing protein n=1 Tax=Fodinicola acaciae TaxID=2681555 RepID=UPI0013D2B02D|nr:CGNR zinc finger domain-containing protein [Fodinicola acaciae]